MTYSKSPASENRGQEFDNDFSESHFIKYPTKHTPRNRQQVLEEIANKWVDKRCYPTFERALVALVRGGIHE
jgi:hypothetical protein